MHLLIFALSALLLAALIGFFSWKDAPQPPPPPASGPLPAVDPGALDALAETVEALLAVMDHPRLGGPGFLAVQLPRRGEEPPCLTVTAQFPNIREALYRRVAQNDLDPAALAAEGVPQVLFDHRPAFSADSGGMVLLTACACPFPDEEQDLQQRTQLLRFLAQDLQERFPQLTVRPLGGELLLSRER